MEALFGEGPPPDVVNPPSIRAEAFIKVEPGKPHADPRNITKVSDEYLVCLGPIISILEHHLGANLDWLTKGLNLTEREIKFASTFDNAGGTMGDTDFSRFDSSLGKFLLVVQAAVIGHVFRFHPRILAGIFRLLPLQWDVRVRHASGWLFHILYQRLSGTSDTSIGNAIINHFSHYLSFWPWGFSSVHEGDDGLWRTSCPDPVQRALDVTASLGLDAKVSVSNVWNSLVFCGRVICEDYSSVCDIPRTMRKFHITTQMSRHKDDRLELLLAKALSYDQTDSHTPIVGPLCRALIRILHPLVQPKSSSREVLRRPGRPTPLPTSDAVYDAVRERWGLSFADCKFFEMYYDSWDAIPDHPIPVRFFVTDDLSPLYRTVEYSSY